MRLGTWNTLFKKAPMKYPLLCLSLLFAVETFGQGTMTEQVTRIMPKPIPQSPNVASLGRYGDYTVSMFTGLPDISIPLFEIKSGSLSVPITLQYHASGVRKSDDASWVGLGWSLSTGGQVSRKVQSLPDEISYLNTSLIAMPSNCTSHSYLRFSSLDVIDTNPDIFTYSFPGKSGSFVLSQNNQPPFLFPYEPIQVSAYDPTDKFEFIDDNGILYRFGKNSAGQTAIDYSEISANNFSRSAITAWQLMEIIAPNSDDKVNYSYQSVGSTSKFDDTYATNITYPCTNDDPDNLCYEEIITGMITNNFTISGQVPYEIIFEGGKVQFMLGSNRTDLPGLFTLDQINILTGTNNNYTLVRSFKFIYSYFLGAARLKLDEIRALDKTGVVVNKYAFTYFTNTLTFGNAIDYWGYYNGKITNTSLVPFQTVPFINNLNFPVGGADRSVDSSFMKQGVLKRIHYPTGGFTEFNFETHQYLEESAPKFAGGLRVKSITSKAGPESPAVTKTYRYGAAESGYGFKTFSLNLGHFKTAQGYFDLYYGPEGIQHIKMYTITTLLSNAMFGMTASDGSPVVYQNVVEYSGQPLNNIGKTTYEFDNGAYTSADITYIIQNGSTKTYTNTLNWKRGKLTNKKVFDKNNNLLRETGITYQLVKAKLKHIGMLASANRIWPSVYVANGSGIPFCTNELGELSDANEFSSQNYSQHSGALTENIITEKIYQPGSSSPIITTTTNTYDTANVLVTARTEGLASDPEVVVTNTKYPTSYSILGSPTANVLGIKMLKDKNIRNEAIEAYSVRQNANGTNARIISGLVMTYQVNPNNLSQVKPEKAYLWESTPSSTYTPSTVSGNTFTYDAGYKPRVAFKSYDGKGNIAETARTNESNESYVWGYSGSLPIAQVKNAEIDWHPDTPLTYFYGSSFSTNFSTDIALTPALVIANDQTVSYSLRYIQIGGGSPSVPPTLDVVLKRSDGTVIYDPTLMNPGTVTTNITLSAGTYTLWYHGESNGATMRLDLTINYVSQTYFPKVFHTSFEDTGTPFAGAKTGSRVNDGAYIVRYPTAAGDYLLSWWQKTGAGEWTYMQQTLSGGAGSVTIGTGAYVDEVRLHPKNATMVTYTYNPLLGITSMTDENLNTTYYGHDNFGRLQWIKDNDGNLVRTYEYHFKGQQN
jgi:hypothetical protein